MAFEIKYDRNGIAVKDTNKQQQLEAIADAIPQTIQPVQEVAQSDSSLAETLQAGIPEVDISAQTEAQSVSEEPTQTATEIQPIQQNESRKEDHPNFRILKQRLEEAQKERDEALKYAKQLQELKTQNQQQNQIDDDIDFNLDPNDYVEPKHLNKFKNKIKNLEQQLYQQQQQAAIMNVETRLKTQYPDFDKIVSKDNVEALRITYPEISETLNASTDLYNKAVTAYTLIKRFGIAQDMIQTQQYDQDREKVQKNAAKPRPSISVNPQQGQSPMSMANAFQNGLTEDLKQQLYKEMIEAKKSY